MFPFLVSVKKTTIIMIKRRNSIKKILSFIDLKLNEDLINFINFLVVSSKNLFFSLKRFIKNKTNKIGYNFLFVQKIAFFELISLII